jgi:hypothetical protein
MLQLNEAIAEQTAKAVEVESELASLKWQDDFKKAANPEANVVCSVACRLNVS